MEDEEPFAETEEAQPEIFKLDAPHDSKKRYIAPAILLVIAMLIGFVVTYKALNAFVVLGVETEAGSVSLKELDAGKFYVKFRGRKNVGQMYLEIDLSVKNSGPAIAPVDPVLIRDSLFDLMVKSAEFPLVKTANDPLSAMRSAMLAVAVVEAPWIDNIKFRRGNVIRRQ